MTLLIDGYNLLNAVGIVGRGTAGTSLHRSRTALLNFLVQRLGADEASRATIVFDATHAPPGLPRAMEHRGLKVRFAPRGSDADTLLEELIRADTTPRRLTVVSSDHRLQRAAHRRRARGVDSDVWFHELIRRGSPAATPVDPSPQGPHTPLSVEEIDRWLAEFGGADALESAWKSQEAGGIPGAASGKVRREAAGPAREDSEKPAADEADMLNPFPPGYGDDLLRDEWERQ